jgi:uncharacterized integral membrane protein
MRWVLFLPLLLLISLFILSNTQEVEVRLWPFDLLWVVRLASFVLAVATGAFLLGAGIAWAAALPARRRLARMHQAARLLEAELAAYKEREEQARRDADLGRPQAGIALPALGRH